MIEFQQEQSEVTKVNREVFLVIPCFRESGRVGSFLKELCPLLDATGGIQLLLVEDGGGSDEAQKLDGLVAVFRERHPFVLPVHHVASNIGKGGAVYEGWSRAGKSSWVAFVDADGSCPAKEVVRLVNLARMEDNPARAYFASRAPAHGKKVTRLWHRRMMGRIFASLTSFMLRVSVRDTQCGLKLLPNEMFMRVHPRLSIFRHAFDAELLLALIGAGADVIEFHIDWHETLGGKISLLTDPWRMFLDILRIQRANDHGRYAQRADPLAPPQR